jgi:transposase
VMSATKGRRGKHRRRQSAGLPPGFEQVNLNAAGIDIGAESHWAAVPVDRDPTPVREFSSFSSGLQALVEWLVHCGITTVAMEATGVYWVPLYELLEARGLQVVLVNAKHFKNVPGRKSDVLDCQWLQQLHTFGLLRGSFRPEAAIVTLRTYLRHREMLVQASAQHIQHMQKALTLMNLQLHHVLSDITGETGMRIIRAIVGGTHDPGELAKFRDPRCHASPEKIAAALTGTYQADHLFVLQQALELFDVYAAKIQACDRAIERALGELPPKVDAQQTPPPAARPLQKPRGHQMRIRVREPLYAAAGVDLTQINGIAAHTALAVVSEIGTDMTRWPTEKHFTSWMCVAPGTKITGGKVISSRTRTAANRVATVLRTAAASLLRSDTALGAFGRRLAARIGEAKALTALTRKLAVHIYNSIKHGRIYKDPGSAAYDFQHRNRVLRSLTKRARSLGYELVRIEPAPASAVS